MNDYEKAQVAVYSQNPRVRKRRKKPPSALMLFLILILVAACSAVVIFEKGNDENNVFVNQGGGNSAAVDETFTYVLDESLTDEEKLNVIQSSSEYPSEMVEFAEKYSQVIDYVYKYPYYKDTSFEIDLSAEASGDSVPLLLQWDERWGYIPYGEGLIGYTGCGPVCLSMVALYLTGDAMWTPAKVAEFSEQNGYCAPGDGTSWTLISRGSQSLGLNAKELPLMESTMKKELDNGHPIIIVVGEGDFTYSGHYLVIVGYDSAGFRVNDPNSPENSKKSWSYDRLSTQIRNLWAMSAL